MRANLILILLIVLATPVFDSDAQLLGRRRSQRQERRMPSQSSQNYSAPSYQSNCPDGKCPYPQAQTVPSQSGGSIMGYSHLNPPTFEPRPTAPAPMALTQTQPAQAVADSPPPKPDGAPAAAKEFSAAKFTELLTELEKLTGLTAQPTTPAAVDPPTPPVPPQPEPSPSPQSQASEVVNSLGVIEVVHRDGNGNTVQSAVIDLSDYVRKEIGSK